MKLSMLISCLLGLALARRGSGGGGSRPSGGSSRPSGGSSRPSGPSISSRPSRPSKTSTRGTSYRPMPYSSSTMSKSWSRRAVSAAAVILLAKQGRRRRGRIYNGWGYDVDDDEWYQNEMWEDLNSCFTCDSFDGSDTNCERLDSSIRIQDLSYQACPANSYCLLAMGTMENENETANRTWLTRRCAPISWQQEGRCPEVDGRLADTCDFCDTNICNGWTLRALPDYDLLNASLPTIASFGVILFALLML